MFTETGALLRQQLAVMQEEKGKVCVTLILPLLETFGGQKADRLHMVKAVRSVIDQLEKEYPAAASLAPDLEAYCNGLELDRGQEGVGIYFSGNIRYHTFFPFAVMEKVVVGESFELTDLMLKLQYAVPYHVLHLDGQRARLLSGSLKELEESGSSSFPFPFDDQYEYQPSARGTSLSGDAHVKSFEKDKTGLEKIRYDKFLHQVDEMLADTVTPHSVIILCGVKRHTSAFLNRTSQATKVIGVINGNYERYSVPDFVGIAWPALRAYIYENMVDEISEFLEKTGEGRTEEGILRVWEAVAEGRGLALLVERDYLLRGYQEIHNPYQLFLRPPRQPYRILFNAVNELAANVLAKKGRVVFVEKGMLRFHQHIALITRY